MVDTLQFQEWVKEKVVVDGLVMVHKPYGIPSTALTEMYKIVTRRKVGHGGTLDPLAEGSMLLGIGPGTKLLTKYLQSEKKYRAEILIGAESTSGDLELPLIIPENGFTYSEESLEAIFEELAQGFTQELPELNAAKQHGKTAYSLVREGKPTEKRFVETKLVEWKIITKKDLTSLALQQLLEEKKQALIAAFKTFALLGDKMGYRPRKYDFMLEKWLGSLGISAELLVKNEKNNFLLLEIEVVVPKGTYIRSLAQDIASRLNTVGVLVGLERVSAGKTG